MSIEVRDMREGEDIFEFMIEENNRQKRYWDERMRELGIDPKTGGPLKTQKELVMDKYKLDEDGYKSLMIEMEQRKTTRHL